MTLIIANALLIAWLAFELVLRRRGQASTWDADVADKNTTKLVVLTYVLLVVVSVFVRRPGHVRADSATAWMFVAIAAIGLLLRGWAMQHLGQFYSRTLRVQDEQRVVDDGPYRFIRHPGYLGSILVWAGSRSALNVVVGGVTLVALVALYMHRIRAEEQLLGRELGDAYTEYAKRSWRLLPGIW